MNNLWDGTLESQVATRRSFWKARDYFDLEIIGCGFEIDEFYRGYFVELQERAKKLVEDNSLTEAQRTIALLDIDARLSFLINEVALAPENPVARFKLDEEKYYKQEYLKLEDSNYNTLLSQMMHPDLIKEVIA